MLYAQQVSDRMVVCDGTNYLFFSGTAYLAINSNATFRNYLVEGLARYGNNYGSSRNSNFELDVFDEGEKQLAAFCSAPASLTMSSGFLAGQLAVRSMNANSKFFFAPNTHPALSLARDDFYHGSFADWSETIAKRVAAEPAGDIVIACDALDPLYSLGYAFDWVGQLPKNKNITVIIDDSHGLGVTGVDGRGVYAVIPSGNNVRKIVVASLAKAMGITGGAIFSDEKTIAMLRQTPMFAGASPLAPAYLHAFIRSAALYADAQSRLSQNVRRFAAAMSGTGVFTHLDGYPVFSTSDNTLAGYLKENKVLVSSFAYPTAQDPVVTRIIINSSHLDRDIDLLAKLILDRNS